MYVSIVLGGSNYDPLRLYVTGSNDATLNEVVQTTAVPLVGAHHGPEGAMGHSFRTPPIGPTGQHHSRCLVQNDNPGLAVSSHKGNGVNQPEPPMWQHCDSQVLLWCAWDECRTALIWG
jgi:hypothetical protein